MDFAYLIAALLGGGGVVAMVIMVYSGIRCIEELQRQILERLTQIQRWLDDGASG